MTKTTPVTQDRPSWQLRDMLAQSPGLLDMARTLAELADAGHPIVVSTADLGHSNGLAHFGERHPGRYLQLGISEQHMVSTGAGLAATGLVPYVATFASFLALLCCEQIRTDVAYTGLPVRLIGHHAGIALGFYGTSHHATEDLAIMRAIPGLTVVAPADAAQLRAALRASVDHDGPMYLRIGRGRDPIVYDAEPQGFAFGHAIEHLRGNELTIIATGSALHPSLAAARSLRAAGRSVGLLDMHTIKPLDREAVLAAARESAVLMTVEEHSVVGGLGGAVAEVLADEPMGVRLHRHGLRDEYSLIGPPTHLYRHYRLDAEGIEKEAELALRRD